jgi:hypothetical protein
MVEVAVELCDGLPGAVEANLRYWLNDVRRYCPWSGRVLKQIVANKGGESHAGAASALFSARTAKLSPTGESHALASPVINAAPVSVSGIRATMIREMSNNARWGVALSHAPSVFSRQPPIGAADPVLAASSHEQPVL